MSLNDDIRKAIGAYPTVDFDYFHFPKSTNNRVVARELAVLLMAHINIDELHFTHDIEDWPSSVGTGGTGSNYSCPSQAAQRSCLASLFSSYAYQQHQSCYISLKEYQCLIDLLQYFEEDYSWSQHQEKLYQGAIDLLKMTCKCFEQAYIREDPGFLFKLIKTTDGEIK